MLDVAEEGRVKGFHSQVILIGNVRLADRFCQMAVNLNGV